MEGCCMFTKSKLKIEEIKNTTAKVLGIEESDICLVEEIDDWAERDNQPIVIEYNGFLDEEDDKEDDYYGYHYYDIWYDNKKFEEKLKELEKAFSTEVIIDME